ncbi:MAG: HlyD family efflux transporter periplasmic adaptor subunit, partial [Oscillospiraceae bacterium]|nr:HlyD family efflux transporter periplasmic adaptor subunit [Oscillospiraceae bacterium]
KWSTALQTTLDMGTAEGAVYKAKLEQYNNAKDNYDTALESLNEKMASDQRTDAGYGVDLADIRKQIDKAKQKLADLTGDEEAQILAKVGGTVQSIECSPGDTKQKDDILATIEMPDMGYSLSFSVTNDQANRLRPGDTATVSNFYWGTEIVATLESIKVDPKNPQTNKQLNFNLTGNVTAGSELTISVGQKSANYDIIIPSSSIRSDSNGSFVLKVEAKNSPLGNRYIARRVPVEVLASDDSNSAVTADLGFGDYVITTSSAPIKNGDLVRLATA